MNSKLRHISGIFTILIFTILLNANKIIASDSVIYIKFVNTQTNYKEYLYPYEKQEIKVFYKSNYFISIYYTTTLTNLQYIYKQYLPSDFDINQLYLSFDYYNLNCTLIAEPDSIVLKKDSLIIYNIKGKVKEVTFEKKEICNNELPQTVRVNYPQYYRFNLFTRDTIAIKNMTFDSISRSLKINDLIKEGIYYFNISSSFCIKNNYDSIKIVSAPQISILEKEIKLCPGNSKIISVKTLNEDQNVVFYWSTGITGSLISIDKPGEYILTAENQFKCKVTDTIKVYEKTIIAQRIDYFTKNVDCYSPGNLEIKNYNIAEGTSPYKFYLKNLITNDTINNLKDLQEGKYKIIIRDAENCFTTYDQIISIDKNCLNDYPILAPSLDKINSTHFIPYEGEAIVYDKNGLKKAKFKTPAYWDGNDNNGNPLPTGTYLIIIQNKVIEVTIIR